MKTLKLLFATAVLGALVACGGPDDGSIPKPYQGVFQDQSGVKLTLTKDSAQLQVEGETLQAAVSPISYDKLLAGGSGFYIYLSGKKASSMDVYWITPDLSSKKEEGGIVYYTTDIVYARIDLSSKDPVPSVTIVHSSAGTVMLDPSSKQWQAGWPAQTNEYSLTRVN